MSPLHRRGWDASLSQLRAGHGVPGGEEALGCLGAQQGNAVRGSLPSWVSCLGPMLSGSEGNCSPAPVSPQGWTGRIPTPGYGAWCRHFSRASQPQHPLLKSQGHGTDKGHRNHGGQQRSEAGTALPHLCCLRAQTALPEQAAPSHPGSAGVSTDRPLCLLPKQPQVLELLRRRSTILGVTLEPN